jgi:hypothetical protein
MVCVGVCIYVVYSANSVLMINLRSHPPSSVCSHCLFLFSVSQLEIGSQACHHSHRHHWP